MSAGGQAILCLEPPIPGPRHSGGFFYNDCLAAAAEEELSSTETSASTVPQLRPGHARFRRQAWDGGRLPSALVLLDSLWWHVHKRPLEVLAPALAGRSWGLIMHGLPDDASGLFNDLKEAGFVVVPSFWAAAQLKAAGVATAAGRVMDIRILYPGWDGRPGLLPGLSASPASERGRPTEPRNVPVHLASTSNWTHAKGLVQAARAFGSLYEKPSCPPWLWTVAGTPDPALIAEAHSGLGPLAGRLIVTGHLDPEAVVRLLRSADIFLHPSNQETFCLSVYEAALAGCRVVARAIGGVPEALQLARLLRSQLGLPPAEIHLAPAVKPSESSSEPAEAARAFPAAAGMTGGADPLVRALEEALEAVLRVVPAASLETRLSAGSGRAEHGDGEPAGGRAVYTDPGKNADSIINGRARTGLLGEYSWRGRLEKLLLGQSDSPLPDSVPPEPAEAS